MFTFERSTAELRMTYCTSLCESRAMVPISVLLQAERKHIDWELIAQMEEIGLIDIRSRI